MITSKQYEELCAMIANYRDAIDALHTAAADDKLWAAGQFAAADRELSDYVKGLAEPVKEVADSDGWIEWSGGECPVPKGTRIDVMHRDGAEHSGVFALGPFNFTWQHTNNDGDIIAYRVVSE